MTLNRQRLAASTGRIMSEVATTVTYTYTYVRTYHACMQGPANISVGTEDSEFSLSSLSSLCGVILVCSLIGIGKIDL